jgi:hypothetical protein
LTFMRRLKLLLLLGGLAGSVVLVGCGDQGDGVKPENAKVLTDVNAAAKAADGNYDSLTEDQKQQALKMANGDEKQARALVHLMAHPPNEGMRAKAGAGGGPGGPAAGPGGGPNGNPGAPGR